MVVLSHTTYVNRITNGKGRGGVGENASRRPAKMRHPNRLARSIFEAAADWATRFSYLWPEMQLTHATWTTHSPSLPPRMKLALPAIVMRIRVEPVVRGAARGLSLQADATWPPVWVGVAPYHVCFVVTCLQSSEPAR